MSQIFWNLVYSLSGVKVRECPSLFLIFAKFGPGGPKNGHFWPFFGHFCSFLDLKTFLESGFFLFFNMMFLGIFRSDLQKIVKKGSKFDPPGPKNGHFWSFFGHFHSFLDLKILSESDFFFYLFNMMFLGIFRSDLQKLWNRDKIWSYRDKKRPFSVICSVF